MCFNLFGNKATGNSDILPLPKSSIVVSGGVVTDIIRARFPDCKLFISDMNDYKLVSDEDMAWFLAQDQTNKMGYVPEVRDCDDFSYRLMGQVSVPGWSDLAFGIVWTDAHALNCVILETKEFFFIEPQTDELQKELKSWQGTNIRFIMI